MCTQKCSLKLSCQTRTNRTVSNFPLCSQPCQGFSPLEIIGVSKPRTQGTALPAKTFLRAVVCCCLVARSWPTLFVTTWIPWICQAPLSMGSPRQEYWSGLPFSSPGDLPNPGIEPWSSAFAGRFLTAEPLGKHCESDNPLLEASNKILMVKAVCIFHQC